MIDKHYNWIDARFDFINKLNSVCTDMQTQGEPKKFPYPADIVNKGNVMAWQELAFELPQDKQLIVEYFTQLGKFLSESQDNIYLRMQTDELGIGGLIFDFSRIG